MARRPAYLAELLKDGETATYSRDTGCWYAVKKTSHRIVGSKYPVVSHEITATLTASGRVEPSSRIKPDIESFEVREVGYSFVLRNLIPVKWKKALKSDQDELFLWLIVYSDAGGQTFYYRPDNRPQLFEIQLNKRLIVLSHCRRTALATFKQLTIR